MPVYKYKSLEEAEKALWNFNPDAAYFKRIENLFNLAFRLNPPKCKRGIFLFKSIEEANEWKKKNRIIHIT